MKRKNIFYLAVILPVAAAGIIFLMLTADSFRTYKKIISKGELRVAVAYNATDYFVSGDSVSGFQYELVNAICDSLHLTPRWTVENSLDKAIDALLAGKVDVVARNIPVTAELRQKLLFLHSISNTPQVLVQRKAEFNDGKPPVRNQIMLGGKEIYVPENSPNILRISNLSEEIADTIIVRQMPHYEVEQLLILVAKGDIDYAVCDRQTAQQAAERLKELDIETAVSFVQMQAWAVNPQSDELKRKIDSVFVPFLTSREYRNIYRKYYH